MGKTPTFLAVLALACSVGAVAAADMPYRERAAAGPVAVERPGVRVVVDDLFLRSDGCPRNPDCIAPRILPVVGHGAARAKTYVEITVPVDPRFSNRY